MNVLTSNFVQQLSLSFSKSLSTLEWQNSVLSFTVTVVEPPRRRGSSVIRMGGGPRTYPGGVSKWQWKRMQANKAKQLMKARLCRERQIYEMRKRAELKAAVSELERPWEVVEKPPKLFSVRADEQLKVLADRFQKPGGFDLWTERDGPQLFQSPDELPSARFFPKGVVHGIKPYRKVTDDDDDDLLDLEGPGVLEEYSDVNGSGNVDDGENGSYSPLDDYGRNEVNIQSGLRGNGNGGRMYLSKDVGWSHDGESSSSLNYGRNGGNDRGGSKKNANGTRYFSQDVDRSYDEESSTSLEYGRNEMNVRGGLKKNVNGQRYFSQDVDRSHDDDSSSRLDYGRNEVSVHGRSRNNGNGRRYVSRDVERFDDGERSSSNYGRNGLNGNDRIRRTGNGRKVLPKGIDGSASTPSNYGRNGASFDGKYGNKGSPRRTVSKDGDRSDGVGDSRLRRKENGRRLVSKDVNGSNAMYTGKDGSDSTHRGSNSLAGRSYGKYVRKTSSPRVRDADSEVFDMDLQQDGSYGIFRKSEQSETTSW